MTSAKEIATDLLRRLLAGERGNIPMHLAMLLEKSSPLCNSDDHYRQILPPELAGVKIPSETVDEITNVLSAEISRNPDSAFILALSFTGADRTTKKVAEILASPPRPLSMSEYGHAVALVNSFLPSRLAENPEFLPESDVKRLVQVLTQLQNIGEDTTDRAERITVRRDAHQLLNRLKQ